jgi:hypothetical protein
MMLSLAGDINGRDADNCLGNVNIVSGEVRLELNTPKLILFFLIQCRNM